MPPGPPRDGTRFGGYTLGGGWSVGAVSAASCSFARVRSTAATGRATTLRPKSACQNHGALYSWARRCAGHGSTHPDVPDRDHDAGGHARLDGRRRRVRGRGPATRGGQEGEGVHLVH